MMSIAESKWLGKPVDGDQRSLILSVAQEVFSEEGFQSAEMRTIARRAGVGKTTIYKFFPSKDQLFLSIVQENLNHMRNLTLAQLIGSGSPWDRLENAVVTVLRFIEDNRSLLRVIVQEAGEFNGEIQRCYFQTADQSIPLVDAFLNAFRKEAKFRQLPTRELVMMMVKLLIGSAYTWSVTEEGSLVDEGIGYFKLLRMGLLEEPSPFISASPMATSLTTPVSPLEPSPLAPPVTPLPVVTPFFSKGSE